MANRRAALLGLGALLGGCGFRPLLKPADDEPNGVREELAAVEVPQLSGRIGFLLRDGLLEQLNPTGREVPRRYRLEISLRSRTSSLGIQLDNTITRYNLTLVARVRLLDSASQRLLYRAVVRRVASYNAIRDPFAEFSTEQDAERRAAREVSHDIWNQLAVHFSRQPEAEPDAPAATEAAPS